MTTIALFTTIPTSMIIPIMAKIDIFTPEISIAGTTPIAAIGTVARMMILYTQLSRIDATTRYVMTIAMIIVRISSMKFSAMSSCSPPKFMLTPSGKVIPLTTSRIFALPSPEVM